MKIIDCEFHYYLPELMDYLATRDQAMKYYPETKILEVRDKIYAHFDGVTNTYPVIDELMNFGAERVAEMDRNGIDVAVMSSSPALEELPEKECVYFAKKSNDAVAELIKKFPGRFLGAAVLPTPYVDEAIKELERCVKELGFKYWHTHSNYMHEHLYEEKYLPLLAKAEELYEGHGLCIFFTRSRIRTGCHEDIAATDSERHLRQVPQAENDSRTLW